MTTHYNFPESTANPYLAGLTRPIYKIGFVGDGKSPGNYWNIDGVSVQTEGMFEVDPSAMDGGTIAAIATEVSQSYYELDDISVAVAAIKCMVDGDGEILESELEGVYVYTPE